MENRRLVFVGDIHGEFREMIWKATQQYELRGTDLVVLGDFGVGFDGKLKYDYGRAEKKMKEFEKEHIKVSTILMILKKNLGYKNQVEVERKTGLDPSFLRIKLCWRTDQDYSELCQILNGIVKFSIESSKKRYRYGKCLLDYVAENRILTFIPYYRALEEGGQKSLMFWTLEKTIERWIKEKF